MKRRLSRAKSKIRDAGIPFSVPARTCPARAAGRRPRGRLPHLQRGLRAGARRARRGGDPPRPRARRADAGRARGARPARAHAVPRRAARGALRRRGARAARRPGSLAVGRRADRGGSRGARPRRWRCGVAARTCCRPRSRRCRRRIASTGRRSRRCTRSSRGLTRSPVVELNRAVAVAEAGAPEAALAIAERVGLDDYRYAHSTRAELLRRLGRPGGGARRLPPRARAHPGGARTPVPPAPPRASWRRLSPRPRA